MTDNEIKHCKQIAAHMALYGLLETLVDPPCPKIFAEAHRIIFNADSPAFKMIAELLETNAEALQKAAFAYLVERGFPVNPATKH